MNISGVFCFGFCCCFSCLCVCVCCIYPSKIYSNAGKCPQTCSVMQIIVSASLIKFLFPHLHLFWTLLLCLLSLPLRKWFSEKLKCDRSRICISPTDFLKMHLFLVFSLVTCNQSLEFGYFNISCSVWSEKQMRYSICLHKHISISLLLLVGKWENCLHSLYTLNMH